MAKPKLHQIIAVVAGKKTRATKLLTDAHHGWKPELISGISRTYRPLDAEGDKLPPESKSVQTRVKDVIAKVTGELIDFYDVVVTQEDGNTKARANVAIDGKVVLQNIPVGALMFLEKQLVDLETFVSHIPTLPTDKEWMWSDSSNTYETAPADQMRTAKIPTTHVKFVPTEHQPGQAEILNIDKAVGTWTTKHFSGAMPAKEQAEIMDRLTRLQEAVKFAREEANSIEIDQRKVGEDVMKYVFVAD